MATKNQTMEGVGAFKMALSQNEEVMFGALLQKANSAVDVHKDNGKPLWRDPDGIKAFKTFDTIIMKMNEFIDIFCSKQPY
ncbi:hypothetical protein SESBI_07823 [Sesbania bispinosa]|nr:hypothetical protein SESBI_07823 [Sesbania bispinosa]